MEIGKGSSAYCQAKAGPEGSPIASSRMASMLAEVTFRCRSRPSFSYTSREMSAGLALGS